VHRVAARLARDAQHLLDRQIGLHRAEAAPDQVALIRLETVEGVFVLLREDRDRGDAELRRGPHDADRDLAAVGDEQFLDALGGHGPRSDRLSCRSLPET
jgi:hypothetical protein